MFVMDVVDSPMQYAPVVIAEAQQAVRAVQAGGESTDRTIGVCHLIQSPEISNGTAVNVLNPLRAAQEYLDRFEKAYPELKGTVTVLQGPGHGELEDLGSVIKRHGNLIDTGIRRYVYHPQGSYVGLDHATFLVEIGGFKINAMYYFKVGASAWGGTEGYDPYQDKENCPNGEVWKISLRSGDPNVFLYTFEQPSQLTNPLTDAIKANLTIADSPFGALVRPLARPSR